MIVNDTVVKQSTILWIKKGDERYQSESQTHKSKTNCYGYG